MDKFIVYKTTNMVNNKIYIGVHKTSTPFEFDGYLGSGGYISNAITKYGHENFIRETLFVYDDDESAYNKESEIVNVDFVSLDNNYNIALGGKLGSHGGWDNVNNSPNIETIRKEHSDRMSGENNPMYGTIRLEHSDRMSGENNPFFGKTHDIKTRNKIKHSRRKSEVWKLYYSGELYEMWTKSSASTPTQFERWINHHTEYSFTASQLKTAVRYMKLSNQNNKVENA